MTSNENFDDCKHDTVARDGCLKSFQRLKDIRLPSWIYLEDIWSDTHLEVAFIIGKKGIQRLIDILPASTQMVQLDGKIDIDDVVYMLLGLPEGKAEWLPNLTRIEYTEVKFIKMFSRLGTICGLKSAGRWE